LLAHGALWSWRVLAAALGTRLLVALTVGVGVLRDRQVWRDLILIPLRDLIAVAVWATSYLGHQVSWRGTSFILENGKLDLTAVEGLGDLIAAETAAQRRQAFRQLKGLIGDRAEAWRQRLIEAQALVEQLIARRPTMRLLSALDGNMGIQLARADQPDVILMDINLPGISGIEALKILREDPTTAHIPVLALSANAMPRDIEKGLEAGFFSYLTKPIKVMEFMASLDSAFDFAHEHARRPRATP